MIPVIPIVYVFQRDAFVAPAVVPGAAVDVITAEIEFKRRTKLIHLVAGVVVVDASGNRKEVGVRVAGFPNTIGQPINPPPAPARLDVTPPSLLINGLELTNNNGGMIDYKPPGGIYIDTPSGTFLSVLAYGVSVGDTVLGSLVLSVFPTEE